MKNRKIINDATGLPLWDDKENKEYSDDVSDLNSILLYDVKHMYQELIYNGFNSTGNIKEELLHSIVIKMLKGRISGDRFAVIGKSEYADSEEEWKSRWYNGKGKSIDITVFDKSLARPVCFIDCKFPLNSTGKNWSNFINTVKGECETIHDFNENVSQFIFNVGIRYSPNKNKQGEINRFDDNIKQIDDWDVAVGRMKHNGCIKDACYCMFDDSLLDENVKVSNMEEFKHIHDHDYALSFTGHKSCKNLIYNDIDRFIESIIESIKTYENENPL